ncbi:hypothetical protein OGCDGJMD_02885 [Cyanobium usitatum str. Tous]|jgi:hypothetical protein|uniref:hypothetical protein n=1 Tax=Cyanobium usitatum TaxID=2304190 RepID=UPI002AD24A28|nr:hypothetical protein [Cyanobium usitatum]CAK6700571.1 hypothetical protein OGCDGJMD_02885 [Cyanobium usitatum str. Tous]
MTSQEKLSALFAENPNYLKEIENFSTPEQVANYLEQKGVTVTSGDLIRYASESVTELDDAALARVAGGAWTNNDDNDRSVVTGAIAFGVMVK